MLLALTGVASFRLARPEPLLEPGERGRISVLPFANATGDPGHDWVELGLMQMLAETLDAAEGIEAVPAHEVLETVAELGLEPGAPLDDAQVRRLTSGLGSELALGTTVARVESGYQFRYVVYRHRREPITKAVTGAEVMATTGQLASRLALRLRPDTRAVDLADRFSDDPYVNRTYAMGVQQLDSAGPRAAAPYFEVCLDRDPGMSWARIRLADARQQLGDAAAGDALLRQALDDAREREDPKLAAEALRQLGSNALDRGDYPAAGEHLRQALAASRDSGDRDGVASSLNLLAVNAYRSGDLGRAEALWNETLAAAGDLGNRYLELALLNNLGLIAYEREDLDAAEAAWTRVVATARELGNRRVEGLTVGNLGLIAEDRGDLAAASGYHAQEVEIHRRRGDRQSEVIALHNLASTEANRGHFERAETLADGALALAVELGQRWMEIHTLALRAGLRTRRGAFAAARQDLDRALALAEELEVPESAANAALSMAYYLLRRGEPERALGYLERAEAAGPTAESLLLRARYEHSRGRFAEAATIAEAARAQAGAAWTDLQEAEWDVYRQSAELGRSLPFPHESPPPEPETANPP